MNSQCRLCGDKDEMINHVMSECSKLPQKVYKTRQEKDLLDFFIQTDHPIPARRLDLVIINKKVNLPNCGLRCPGGS